MTNILVLIGLILEIIGVGILIRDEITPLVAILKQDKAKRERSLHQKFTLLLAKLFGSGDPLDTESYVDESFPRRFYGFIFLLMGFTVQAIAVIIQIIKI